MLWAMDHRLSIAYCVENQFWHKNQDKIKTEKKLGFTQFHLQLLYVYSLFLVTVVRWRYKDYEDFIHEGKEEVARCKFFKLRSILSNFFR